MVIIESLKKIITLKNEFKKKSNDNEKLSWKESHNQEKSVLKMRIKIYQNENNLKKDKSKCSVVKVFC